MAKYAFVLTGLLLLAVVLLSFSADGAPTPGPRSQPDTIKPDTNSTNGSITRSVAVKRQSKKPPPSTLAGPDGSADGKVQQQEDSPVMSTTIAATTRKNRNNKNKNNNNEKKQRNGGRNKKDKERKGRGRQSTTTQAPSNSSDYCINVSASRSPNFNLIVDHSIGLAEQLTTDLSNASVDSTRSRQLWKNYIKQFKLGEKEKEKLTALANVLGIMYTTRRENLNCLLPGVDSNSSDGCGGGCRGACLRVRDLLRSNDHGLCIILRLMEQDTKIAKEKSNEAKALLNYRKAQGLVSELRNAGDFHAVTSALVKELTATLRNIRTKN